MQIPAPDQNRVQNRFCRLRQASGSQGVTDFSATPSSGVGASMIARIGAEPAPGVGCCRRSFWWLTESAQYRTVWASRVRLHTVELNLDASVGGGLRTVPGYHETVAHPIPADVSHRPNLGLSRLRAYSAPDLPIPIHGPYIIASGRDCTTCAVRTGP